MVRTAGAQLQPAVQTAEEATSRRGAYGQAAYAAGLVEQAEVKADEIINKAMIDMEQGNTESTQQAAMDLMRMQVDLTTGVDMDLDDPNALGTKVFRRINEFLQVL